MTYFPTDGLALVVVVFLLGAKHGMDADHLATIDGLTRFNALARPRVSRWAGLLFSLGHGLVVTLVALLVATVLHEWQVPPWLEHAGVLISVAFLVALGTANLVAVLRTPAERVVRVAGVRGRLFGRLAEVSHPVVIAAVGAAFALSFDTVGQAALFSLTGSEIAGWGFAVALGAVFTLGMMTSDTINGLWIARLLCRADRRGLRASRVMTSAIAIVSFAIAAAALARYLSPVARERLEALGLWAGVTVVAAMAASFAVAAWLGHRRSAPAA